jgi:hypothetical protein
MSIEKNKKIRKDPKISFRCTNDFLNEVEEGIEKSGLEFSEVGRALFDFFIHLQPGDQKKILALHDIQEALRKDPHAIQHYTADIEQQLAVELPRQNHQNDSTPDPQNNQ